MLTYPLLDGNGADRGIWDPKNNDLAWEVLLPSLRLASMILAHLHTHPWVSAFREFVVGGSPFIGAISICP